MGRPATHDTDQLLDAALALAALGPERVTVAAVARAAGAPSGSVYHRFPSRSALLGALWVRTVASFQEGFLAALEGGDPEAARVGAAAHVLSWSRGHPEAALALLHGASAYDQDGWPAEPTAAAAAQAATLDRALEQLAGRTPGGRAENIQLLTFVTVDAPYAIVRRHLRAGQPIPASADEVIERCARTLAGQL